MRITLKHNSAHNAAIPHRNREISTMRLEILGAIEKNISTTLLESVYVLIRAPYSLAFLP